MLLTYGADVNIMDNGKTIAHTAAELNDTLLLLILGRHKADFSVKNDEGETPLMVAIALCNMETGTFCIREPSEHANQDVY
jgi:ankyrin repeat protein